MSDARPTQQLAADVQLCLSEHHRVGYEPVWGERCPVCVERAPFAALDALVARVTDLEAQREALVVGNDELLGRVQAAEAQVAALTAEGDEWRRAVEDTLAEGDRAVADMRDRAEAAEAEVERLRSDKDERDWRTLEIVNQRAKSAEALLATTRQALTEISEIPYQSGRARGDVAIEIARRALAATDGDTEEGT